MVGDLEELHGAGTDEAVVRTVGIEETRVAPPLVLLDVACTAQVGARLERTADVVLQEVVDIHRRDVYLTRVRLGVSQFLLYSLMRFALLALYAPRHVLSNRDASVGDEIQPVHLPDVRASPFHDVGQESEVLVIDRAVERRVDLASAHGIDHVRDLLPQRHEPDLVFAALVLGSVLQHVHVAGEPVNAGVRQSGDEILCHPNAIRDDVGLEPFACDVPDQFHETGIDEGLTTGDADRVDVSVPDAEVDLSDKLLERAVTLHIRAVAPFAVDVADVGRLEPLHGIVIARPRPAVVVPFLGPVVGVVEPHRIPPWPIPARFDRSTLRRWRLWDEHVAPPLRLPLGGWHHPAA